MRVLQFYNYFDINQIYREKLYIYIYIYTENNIINLYINMYITVP